MGIVGLYGVLVLSTVACVTGRPKITDPSMNLKHFVKLTSTLDPASVTISYINGSVYTVIPGERSRKLFYFEGFNINRRLPTTSGDYQSLSCELVVYRDVHTRRILHTWENPLSMSLNEVFLVQNYPVNSLLTKNGLPLSKPLTDDITVYNSDVPLRYPNPLPPQEYPRYSAGPFYVGTEFFEFFGRQREIFDDSKMSVNVTVTWNRISQWLPWMGLGSSKGNLFYSAFSWKAPSFRDFPADILKLLHEKFQKFLSPPPDFNIPNETTWRVFKKIIDERRKAGLPDIIFGPDDIVQNATDTTAFLDPRLENLLVKHATFHANWSGEAYSFTDNRPSINLFKVNGDFTGRLELSGARFTLELTVAGRYLDSKSGREISTWFNPFTNRTVKVPTIQMDKVIKVPRQDVESFLISPSNEIGLSLVTSDGDSRDWYTTGCMLVFAQELLSPVPATNFSYYGTYTSMSSWQTWMNMDSVPGYMSFRMNVLSAEPRPEKHPPFPPIVIPLP